MIECTAWNRRRAAHRVPVCIVPPGLSRAGVSARAFTLLEVVLVVAVLGIVAGLVAVRIASTGAGASECEVLRQIAGTLNAARIDAMRRGAERSVVLRVNGEDLVIERDEKVRVWEGLGARVRMTDDRGALLDERRAVFNSWGRTDERAWRFLANGGTGASGRMWVVRFDAVSGEARVVDADEDREEWEGVTDGAAIATMGAGAKERRQ